MTFQLLPDRGGALAATNDDLFNIFRLSLSTCVLSFLKTVVSFDVRGKRKSLLKYFLMVHPGLQLPAGALLALCNSAT